MDNFTFHHAISVQQDCFLNTKEYFPQELPSFPRRAVLLQEFCSTFFDTTVAAQGQVCRAHKKRAFSPRDYTECNLRVRLSCLDLQFKYSRHAMRRQECILWV